MFKSPIFIVMALVILFLASCAPIIATPPPIVTEEPGIPVTGVALVQSVEIQILESQPLQVNAIVRGQLPDAGCTTISSVSQVQNDNIITITLTTTTDPVALCAQALTPFEQVVALDMSNLTPGHYKVHVNGIEQAFDLPARDVSQFKELLVEDLNARDYESLKGWMDQSFLIAYWQSEGTSNTPEAAVEQLQRSLLNASSPIVADPNKDLAALLGTDPVTIVGPEVIEASPLFTSGWGAEGKDEAILFAAKQPNGDLYWHGLLFAKDGVAKAGPIVVNPVDTNVYPTGVQYVMAQQDVYIYNGPDTSFAIVGQVYNGMITRVMGTNVYGNWWRVLCPDGSAGNCWVSGHPAFTLPYNYPPPPVDPIPTNVEYVVALKDVFIRNGPGMQYDIIGSLQEGQTARVTGISPDGNWWRIKCTNSSTGSCWVTALPNLTEPTTPPHHDQPKPPGNPQPTNVKYIIAQQEVPIYGGPESQYSIIGTLSKGQIAQVTAVSADGKWWQIVCPDNAAGNCWVSTDPDFTKPTDQSGLADVQSVEIQILESDPVQVNAIARGYLPDSGCTTIADVTQVRNGNTFTMTVKTKYDPQVLCAQALTPFEQVISLDVSSLLPANYIVIVNGVETSFQLPGRPQSVQ
ncbi:MAG TPA: hypothetical protein VFH34_16095 [Anaerolineales bacterium]|nr:hypothetical protein [Anaerolineales bacterium]